jgi:hypothetical protein
MDRTPDHHPPEALTRTKHAWSLGAGQLQKSIPIFGVMR